MAAPYEQKQRLDLFVTTHFPPAMKLDGKITRITDEPLTAEKCMEIAFSIMSAKQAEEFSSTNECNFAISLPDTSRFRVNAMIQRGATALVFRAITSKIPKFESLNLPPTLKDVALKNAGWLFCRRPARANRLRSPRLSTTAMKIRSDTSSPSKIRSSLSTNTKLHHYPARGRRGHGKLDGGVENTLRQAGCDPYRRNPRP